MSETPSLISDLAVILIIAGLVTILFKKLRQPVVLGYIVAGLLAGPAIKAFPTVTDMESIHIWADIGVVFLLFTLGLEFSFKKLFKVGGTAIIGAVTIVIGMMSIGYLTGTLLGWGRMNSLFLGGMMSMSSTTIIFKAFDDMGLRDRKFAGVVLGILVVEDLFAVLLMVLLSTLAVGRHVEGIELLASVMKLGVFLLLCFIVGIYLIPSFLGSVRKYLNDETLLIVSLGLCLGMVLLATKAGFSSALGAFVMGSLLAETVQAEHIERVVKPVKDLFGAIFFVSVGMLIDPAMLWEYRLPIVIITLVVMAGQIFFSVSGILLSGQSVKVAIQSGFSLAQIGEFAFIIASLGLSLNVTDRFLYPIVVAVSVITTFFTPYMIRLAEPAYRFVERVMPEKWMNFLDRYASGSNTIRQKSDWNKLLKALAKTIGIYAAITAVMIFIWLRFVSPLITDNIHGLKGQLLSLVAILVPVAPMLRAIIMKKNHSEEFLRLWHDNKFNRGPLIFIIILRILLCIGLVMILITQQLNTASGIGFAVAAVIILAVMFSKRLKKHSMTMERHFMTNLTARETELERQAAVSRRFANNLLERDLHIADFEVKQNSPSIGRTLTELNFRQKCNVNVVTIIRGDRRINIPGGNERLYPFDRLAVVGTDEDLACFRSYVEARYRENSENAPQISEEVAVEQIIIGENSRLAGRTVMKSGIRNDFGCLVICIEHEGRTVKNPSPDTVLTSGDVVWIVGEHKNILRLSDEEKME